MLSADCGYANYVGGLVGYNGGSISICYSTGAVSGYGWYVGGLVGENSGSISICYPTGAVSDGGGLVGYNNTIWDPIVLNSFWDINSSGQMTSAGGTGMTTAQMQTLSTFISAGWDFVDETAHGTLNFWQMSPGSYPELSVFNGYIIPEPKVMEHRKTHIS